MSAYRKFRGMWDRKFWGVEFKSKGETPLLIGGGWHPAMRSLRYVGEPTRPVLFTTRAQARAWCMEKMAEPSVRSFGWRFRPVRVRETVSPVRTARK